MQGNILLLILVLWPMVGALIGYLIGRKSKTGRDYFADFVGISEFVLIAAALVRVAGGKEMSFYLADKIGRAHV